MIGTSIAHYEVTAKLGEGGMGVVYRARDTKLNRDVAIKLLPEQLAVDAERHDIYGTHTGKPAHRPLLALGDEAQRVGEVEDVGDQRRERTLRQIAVAQRR